MENRRQTYRHTFGESDRVSVEITPSDGKTTLRGELVDLSIEGMKIRLEAKVTLELGVELTIRLNQRRIPSIHLPLSLVGQVKHVEDRGQHVHLGIQFLQQASPTANDPRESKLSHFLAEEQRRFLRLRLAVQRE